MRTDGRDAVGLNLFSLPDFVEETGELRWANQEESRKLNAIKSALKTKQQPTPTSSISGCSSIVAIGGRILSGGTGMLGSVDEFSVIAASAMAGKGECVGAKHREAGTGNLLEEIHRMHT